MKPILTTAAFDALDNWTFQRYSTDPDYMFDLCNTSERHMLIWCLDNYWRVQGNESVDSVVFCVYVGINDLAAADWASCSRDTAQQTIAWLVSMEAPD